ncbi:carbohydrate-binding module family 50 protein [Myriangium duriaei CBS 260.36]|uniref:Carbohydrate-binding module family 50 protein n=1 Tax=Myriangium duriaei CBS 260.36 TaxID=1168546 RepID=A0A9P4MPL8_9PEZI|nr:carbohydrate-binding module family 50 protein [Myriangium duriaei CBS 260.36]
MLPFAVSLLILFTTALADFVIFEPGLIANTTNVQLSQPCLDAMQQSLQCDQYLQNIIGVESYSYMDPSVFNGLCTSTCKQSLQNYHTNVVSACAKDQYAWPGTPHQLYGDQIWAKYNLTCLQDNQGNYCQNYFANLTKSTNDVAIASLPKAQLCTPCILNLGVLNQGTSYSNYGPKMAKNWASVQSICGVSYPTAIPPVVGNRTDLPGYAPSGYPVASCGTGKTYKVVSGDDCGKIAAAQGVPKGTLMSYNNVLPDCSDLQVGQPLCVPNSCKLYQIQSGDTCFGIVGKAGITITQLHSWNPFIDAFCTNLIAGDSVCVAQPGPAWTGTTIAGASATKTAIYATATVVPPGATAHGTTKSCGKYYKVNLGDDCHLIALNQTITVDLFQKINPDVNAQCSNLVEGLYYCVLPTADWNNTDTGTTSSCSASPAAPTPTGTTSQCCQYYTIQSGDYCGKVESSFGITMAQLMLWNPDLKSDCSNLQLGAAYCVSGSQAVATGGAVAKTDLTTATTKTAAAKSARALETPAPSGVLMQPFGRMANKWFEEADKIARIRADFESG